MKNKAQILGLTLLFMLSLILSGCTNTMQAHYTYAAPETAEGKLCVSQCEHSRDSCEQLCSSKGNNQECLVQAKEQARYRYNEYVAKQHAEGQRVTKDANSFYDSRNCLSPSCSCAADYQACYQLCGGQVIQ